MAERKGKIVEKIAFTMVLLMALLQLVYAVYAYIDPQAFAQLRGTELFASIDSDWVGIYASRTLFVALIIGFLLFIREYNILMWASLFGTVMPITDAWLAFHAGAEDAIVYKHVATAVYLLATMLVLRLVVKSNEDRQ